MNGAPNQYLTIGLRRNSGKGTAIRKAIPHVQGELVIIQDADLEYDPSDYPLLAEPLLSVAADFAFGSRYLRHDNFVPWTPNRICVVLLNWAVFLLFFRRLSDEASCYKMCRAGTLRSLRLVCRRFEPVVFGLGLGIGQGGHGHVPA